MSDFTYTQDFRGSNTYIVFDGGGYLTVKSCTDVSLVRAAIQGDWI